MCDFHEVVWVFTVTAGKYFKLCELQFLCPSNRRESRTSLMQLLWKSTGALSGWCLRKDWGGSSGGKGRVLCKQEDPGSILRTYGGGGKSWASVLRSQRQENLWGFLASTPVCIAPEEHHPRPTSATTTHSQKCMCSAHTHTYTYPHTYLYIHEHMHTHVHMMHTYTHTHACTRLLTDGIPCSSAATRDYWDVSEACPSLVVPLEPF